MRRGLRVAALVLALLAVGAAALPWLAAHLVERALRAELAARGIAPVQMGDVRVGASEAVVRDLVLGDGALRAGALRAEYTLRDLLRGRIDRLTLQRVRARAQRADAGRPGTLDALARKALGDDGASGEAAGALPLRALAIEDLHVVVQTDEFDILLAVDGELARRDGRWLGAVEGRIRSQPDRLHGRILLAAETDALGVGAALVGDALPLPGAAASAFSLALAGRLASGRFAGTLALDATTDTAAGPLVLSLPTAEVALDLDARTLTFDAGADGKRGALALPELALRLEGLEGALDAGADPPELRLHASRVLDLAQPPRLPPLTLDATLGGPPGAPLRARGALTGARDRIALRFEGMPESDTGSVRIGVRLPAVRFEEEGLQPADLSPRLSALSATAGRVAAEGELVWEETALRSDLRISLEDLAGELRGVAFEGLEGTLRLSQPWPPAAPPGQTLRIARAALGLEARNVAIQYALDPPGVLDVASARAGLLGGVVRTQGRFDPAQPRNAFVLEVADVDLAPFAAALALEGLTARGRLSGRIPLAIREDGTFVEGGALAAAGPGTLRYRPGAGAALAGDDSKVRLLLDALRDFHYRELRITLDGELAGELDVTLHLAGSSPDFYEGHPVEFNLNLAAPIAAILQGFELEALPERILRDLRQRELPREAGVGP